MSLSTAADYINNRVLRHACQLRPGYTASPELQQDVLNEWTALIDEWNTERTMPFTVPRYTYAIAGSGYNHNNLDYQIGPGAADFNGPRPEKILKANLVLTTVLPNVRIPIKPVSFEEYYSISALALSPVSVTDVLYYEPTFPIGVIHFWPPLNANSLELFTDGVLVAPTALTSVVAGTFPPGYENAVIYSLAHRCQYLCTKEMGPRNPSIGAWALRARQKIRNVNQPNPKARSDFRSGRHDAGSWDIDVTLTGEPY